MIVRRTSSSRSRVLRFAPLFLMALAFSAPACSSRVAAPVVPAAPQGVTADFISQPVSTLDFSRFVVDVIAYNWDHYDGLDASWTWDANQSVWRRHDVGYSRDYISPDAALEARDETEVTLVAKFLRLGVPVKDLIVADRARLEVVVRQRRYSPVRGARLARSYDVVARFNTTFGMNQGNVGTIVAPGVLDGWWDDAQKSGGTVSYDGTAELRFDFPGHFVTCPSEQLAADVRVMRGGSEIDRFSGAFSAKAGEAVYSGRLVSERGPWSYAIDGNRSCPATGEPETVPTSFVAARH